MVYKLNSANQLVSPAQGSSWNSQNLSNTALLSGGISSSTDKHSGPEELKQPGTARHDPIEEEENSGSSDEQDKN